MVIPRSNKSVFLRLISCVAAFLMLGVCPIARGADADVEAQLDRDTVPAGNGVLMTIRIAGNRSAKPEIPKVENLIIDPRGESTEIKSFNGQTSTSVTYRYIVGSNTPGTYQIPAIDVVVNGSTQSTLPLTLKVLDRAAANPPAGIPPNQQNQQPATGEDADTADSRFGFLTVDLASSNRKYVYVGEIAPVRIRAWLPASARAQLRSGIQPEGKAFTLHHVSEQPQQTQEMRDGKRYLVVTWFGGISATKAGTYPVSLSVDATVAVRDTSAPKPRRRMGGPFDDPFFDSMFDDMTTPMIQKDVTLKSDDQQIEVRALPAADRPADFTGAVGNFKFDSWNIPAEWRTGEPQQIAARLNGTGNFALMNAPDVTPPEKWKNYPGKGEFTPGDEASFSGNKFFQFNAVPRKSGSQKVGLSFSFFNPEAGTYQTITTPPQQIRVTGDDMPDEQPATAAAEPQAPKKDNGNLVAQHLTLSPRASLVPLVKRPLFVSLLIISAALVLLGKLIGWLRARRNDPQRRARTAMEAATRDALSAARRCAAARDVTGFFAAARTALQHRLSASWNQPAQAITLAEIQARLPADSAVARFFREAYQQEYSRQREGEVQPHWRSLLDEAMQSLTSSTPQQ